MKKHKIIFHLTTGLIFLFEGVLPALTSHTEIAREGISHLGYPPFFAFMLAFFKVSGALALVIPKVPEQVKEWAYAGFTFTFISAFISHWVVDGFGIQTIFPLLALAFLALSYRSYHTLKAGQALSSFNKPVNQLKPYGKSTLT